MDRKMFDMAEFLRDSGRYRANPTPISDGVDKDCVSPLTMAFVNIQPLDSVYPTEEAFCNGTLFPNLNKPFCGGSV